MNRMASLPQHGSRRSSALALALVWLAAATALEAQKGPDRYRAQTLDRKAASSLVLRQTVPEYPPVAKVNYIQGKVQVEVLVSRDGSVAEAHVLRGHPLLAASALREIRRWLYRPFLGRSGPAEFMTVVEMNFALHSKRPEQLPVKAEEDLDRQVHPPQILARPAGRSPGALMRLRILVSDEGQAMDVRPLGNVSWRTDMARRDVEQWTFRPAYWGTLPVPWYLDVDVPVVDSSLPSAARGPGGH